MLAAGVAVIAIQAAIPSVPVLAEAFRATSLDASDWAIVAAIAGGRKDLLAVIALIFLLFRPQGLFGR